jgi:molybdopterin molybdotransferase
VPIVTLPGNPVSSFISFELYVRPLIRRLMGKSDVVRPTEPAVCLEGFGSPSGKTQYARGVLEVRADGSRAVTPVGGQGSHVVGGLAQSDALIVVPPEVSQVEPGDLVTVIDLGRQQP